MNKYQLDRMLEVIHTLDIAHNPAPEAIFDPLSLGFNIWCTPADNPGGDWLKITKHMIAAAYTKPCDYVTCIFAKWDEDIRNVTHFALSTDAYALHDHLPGQYTEIKRLVHNGRVSIHNRPDDIAWAIEKTNWLFVKTGLPVPEIIVEDD